MPNHKRRLPWLLAAGLLVQLVLAARTPGYPYDLSCFYSWALRMAEKGPWAFYTPDYFCDYPPGYLLFLWPVGALLRALGLSMEAGLSHVLLALPSALALCGLAALVWAAARPRLGERCAWALAIFTQFNPGLVFDTAIWKQIDVLFALPLALTFWALEKQAWRLAAVCYGVALALKPQALLAGPVLALGFLAPLAAGRLPGVSGEKEALPAALVRLAQGIALSLAPMLAAGLPFFGMGLFPGLSDLYLTTAQSYPYASLNSCGLFAALGGNWAPQTMLLGPLSWQQWGLLFLGLLTAALFILAAAMLRRNCFSPTLLAAFYVCGVCILGHRMHERYLLAGLVLLMMATARWGERRLFAVAGLFSLTTLVNLALVMGAVDTEKWLSDPLNSLTLRLYSVATIIGLILLAAAADRLSHGGKVRELASGTLAQKKLFVSLAEKKALWPAQPPWTKKEGAFLAGLTALSLALALAFLGSFQAPEKALDTQDGAVTTTVELAEEPAALWVYTGITWQDGLLTVANAVTGQEVLSAELRYSTPFRWTACPLAGGAGTAYAITVQGGTVLELSFRSAAGEAIAPVRPVQGEGSALFDEGGQVPKELGYASSTYFDEIYHARTAYEHLHRLPVYETTHPPLGKDLIALGIALFGMTGFGWRVAGALFGAAMVPVFYLFVRRLTGRPQAAGLTALLFALDGLRLTQTRMATIDVYATFFILLAAYGMVWLWQSAEQRGFAHSLAPMALSGLAFGLACASKWTGLYAGAGLAVVYFLALWHSCKLRPKAARQEAFAALWGGVVFFVVFPFAIYLASYLPYWLRDPSFGLKDWWACQTLMYRYHAGLVASHPYESRWFTWPLLLRPVWYYAGTGLAQGLGAAIASVGSPFTWAASTAGLLGLGWRQLTGRPSRAGATLAVLWLSMMLPWVMIERCTFLYHYFPGFVFALAALGLVLARAAEKYPATVRRAGAVLAALAAGSFALFWPVWFGLPVARGWLDLLQWLPTWNW